MNLRQQIIETVVFPQGAKTYRQRILFVEMEGNPKKLSCQFIDDSGSVQQEIQIPINELRSILGIGNTININIESLMKSVPHGAFTKEEVEKGLMDAVKDCDLLK